MKKTALAPYLTLIILFSTVATTRLSNLEPKDCLPFPVQAAIDPGSYSEAPQILWNKTISEWNETAKQNTHSFTWKIIQASDGGYVVAGASNGSSSKDWYDFWLVKTDSNANVEWEKTFGGPYQDFAYSVIETVDGGYAIAGTMNDKIAVVKTDSAGNAQWNRTYSDSIRASIIQTSDGGYAIAGDDRGRPKSFHESIFGEPSHFQLVKTDDSGNEEWSKTYGEGIACSLVQTIDGGYALVGTGAGLVLIKTDSLGELEWTKTYGSDDTDCGLSVVQTSDGAFVLFGMLTVDRRCPGLIKTDAEGNELWAKNYLRERAIASDMVGTHDGGFIFCANEDWTIEEGDVFHEIVKVDSQGNILWVLSLVDGNAGMFVVQTSDGGYALLETRNLYDYDSWEEYYSAVWIIKTGSASVDATPTVSPTSTPSPEPTSIADSFPTILVIASASTVAVVVTGLLVYIKKRKRQLFPNCVSWSDNQKKGVLREISPLALREEITLCSKISTCRIKNRV